jgi:hypothetical protein
MDQQRVREILENAVIRATEKKVVNVMVVLVDDQERWSIAMPAQTAHGTGPRFLRTAVKFFAHKLLEKKDG